MVLTFRSDLNKKINIKFSWGNFSESDNLKDCDNIKMNIRNTVEWEMAELVQGLVHLQAKLSCSTNKMLLVM
jgi:hypothetical protein